MTESKKLRPEVKEKWLAALRSGEYEQTTGYLHTDKGYCCLGVLCEIAVEEGVIESSLIKEGLPYYSYVDGFSSLLPPLVSEWAGIHPEGDPWGLDPSVAGRALSDWNDQKRYNFNQIADLIEEYL